MCTAIAYAEPPKWSAFLLFLALFLALLAVSQVKAGEGLQTVAEHYDCIRIEHEIDDGRDWQMRRAYFIRGGKVIAERGVHDEMLWTSQGGRFLLVWKEYGTCWREITFDHLVEIEVHTTDRPTDQNPWWGQLRNMRDLRAPD